MASILPETRATRARSGNFTQRMSRNIAFALLVYTMLMIFMVAPALSKLTNSLAPYFALLLLVGVVIPYCRGFERRWQLLQDSELSQGGLETRFRLDQVKIWGLAIIVPVGIAVVVRSIVAVA